jgi:hypothetical protein
MGDTKITPVETGHRIQLPAEWAAELGLDKTAALERTAAGILVRPIPAVTWNEVFREKLAMGQEPAVLDLPELSGDDILL